MSLIYDLLFIIFSLIYVPYGLWKGKFPKGIKEKLGFLPLFLHHAPGQHTFWIHAVSVGEARAAQALVEVLRREFPSYRILISTVTPTGRQTAISFMGREGVFYFPFDLSWVLKRVIQRIRPTMVIVMETEIWPNFIHLLSRYAIPIVLVNGRISSRSFKGYRRFKFLFSPLWKKITLYGMQTRGDCEKVVELGVPWQKVKLTGNLKFDHLKKDLISQAQEKAQDFRRKLSLSPGQRILVAGSTHAGEEETLLKTWARLRADFPHLRLILAPRHPERSPALQRLISSFAFCPRLVSEEHTVSPDEVMVVDGLGQLLTFYALADVVFVGGSLVPKGGHNILEPAFFTKPVIFGPYMSNFFDIAQMFLEKEAAVQARDEEELFAKMFALLQDQAQAAALGKRAYLLVQENQGASQRTAELIKRIVAK